MRRAAQRAARLAVATLCAAAVLAAAPAAASADTTGRFYPEQRLSKGWFGVLTYKFVRDEIPGGRTALSSCSTANRFEDLSRESQFKRDALTCLAGLGYFDEVPLPDGRSPGWRTAGSSAPDPESVVATKTWAECDGTSDGDSEWTTTLNEAGSGSWWYQAARHSDGTTWAGDGDDAAFLDRFRGADTLYMSVDYDGGADQMTFDIGDSPILAVIRDACR